VSSVSQRGSSTALKALELGAVQVIPKPSESYTIASIEMQLVDAVRAAATANIKHQRTENSTENPRQIGKISITTTEKILAIGASTGGTEAIKEVLTRLPENIPGTVIVQHMPPVFTRHFAERLDSICSMKVKEAIDGDRVIPGVVLIAPGDYHMVLRRSGYQYYVNVKNGPLVWHQRPAVDVLFKSVAKYAGHNSVGVILTGMGKDGAASLKLMHEAGAKTIAQNERTCVVYGMPKEAILTGAVDYEDNLCDIPERIINLLND
ncbi:MAG: chemotaxis-specific protein-glutamate methyltransferase CheB, partial [Candidatus Cloacimonetes bacterium]|nr:chemotaxis-specific protein-glutamate methyltransferase CheB [Candidatus Cloacimonadota bacterium]